MLVAVEGRRRDRERRGREEAARSLREREAREQERLKQVERARTEQFEALAGRWQRAEVLRGYVEALQEEAGRRSGQVEAGGGLARWLEWAEAYIRSLDPLLSTKLPSIEGDELEVA